MLFSLSAEFKATQEAKLTARLSWLREADGELLLTHVLPAAAAADAAASAPKLEGVAAGIMNKLCNVTDVKAKKHAYLELLGEVDGGGGASVKRKGKEKKAKGESFNADDGSKPKKKAKASDRASAGTAGGAFDVGSSADDDGDGDGDGADADAVKKKKRQKQKIQLTGELAERYADLSSGSDEYERGSSDDDDEGGGAAWGGAGESNPFADDGSGMFMASLYV